MENIKNANLLWKSHVLYKSHKNKPFENAGRGIYMNDKVIFACDITIFPQFKRFFPKELRSIIDAAAPYPIHIPPIPYTVFLFFLSNHNLGNMVNSVSALHSLKRLVTDKHQGCIKHPIVLKLLSICLEKIGDVIGATQAFFLSNQLEQSSIDESQRRLDNVLIAEKVTLATGHIELEQVEAVVCAVDTALNLATSGTVAKTLLVFGGKQLATQCKEQHPSGIKYGEVISINGGQLKAKRVYLVALPDYVDDIREESDAGKNMALRNSVCAVLNSALRENMMSIALPAIGTSKLNLTPETVAKTMYDCVKTLPYGSLMEVRFVLQDQSTIKAFEEEYFFHTGNHYTIRRQRPH